VNDDELLSNYPPDIRGHVAAALNAQRRRAESKTRSRWGKAAGGERLPGYQVVVKERTRHGARKRHTFSLDEDTWDEPGGPHWRVLGRQPIPTTVNLAKGVDVAATALVVILEALVSGSRHQIDVDNVKVIVSELGSRIAQLGELSAEDRQHAEPALYTEILARCTNI
jgi:hypothetical protein